MHEELGAETPVHNWPGAEADALRRSLEHITDLQHVVDCCDLLVQQTPEGAGPVMQALYESALITYARCFASGRHSQITEARVAAAAGPEALRFHRYFMKIRDQHVAHKVLPHAHLSVGVAVTPENVKPFNVLGAAHLVVRRVADAEVGIQSLRALALQLIALHGEKAAREQAALVASALDAGEEAVRAQPLVQFRVPDTDIPDGPPAER